MKFLAGRQAWRAAVMATAALSFRPMPRLTGSQWAESYRVLSPEATKQHGSWRNDMAPYLAEIMDAVTSRDIQRVTVVAPSQSGKTELLLNLLGYFIHQKPAPLLVIQPTVEMAQDFSKLRVAPMLRDCPVLAELVRAPRSRDSNNTILSKQYPGGQADFVGANSPAGLAARPKLGVFLDEVDRAPDSAGGEGDPYDIAYARTRSYQRSRKIVAVSSPTLEPVQDSDGKWTGSRIWREFMVGTREVWQVPCSDCGVPQTLEFRNLKWQRSNDGRGPVIRDSVGYQCATCSIVTPASEKQKLIAAGNWHATATSADPVHRSFRIHGLVAAFALWDELAQEYVDKHSDPVRYQTFVNTALGECWKDKAIETQADALKARGRRYDGGEGDEPVRFQVPMSAGILTCGVDVQHDRFELVVRAWGVGLESWLIETAVIRCDTSQPGSWVLLEQFRTERTWLHEAGARLPIRAMAVDAGDGTHAKMVYKYCAPRHAEHVYAIKGSNNPAAPLTPNKPTKVKPGKLYLLGVNSLTEQMYKRLAMPSPGAGYLHLNEYADEDYVKQLLSMVRQVKNGKRSFGVRANVRNEKHDCENYAHSALLLGPVPVASLAGEVARVNLEGALIVAAEKEGKVPAKSGGVDWFGGSSGSNAGGWLSGVRG